MIIFASPNEINDTLQYFKPGFPEQHLENAGEECFYIFNEVPVFIRLIENGKECEFTNNMKRIFGEQCEKEMQLK